MQFTTAIATAFPFAVAKFEGCIYICINIYSYITFLLLLHRMFLWPKGQKFPELKNAHKIILFLNNSCVGGFEEGKSV